MAQNNLARQIKHLIQVRCQESRTGDWVQLRKLGILSVSKIAEHWKGTPYGVVTIRIAANI